MEMFIFKHMDILYSISKHEVNRQRGFIYILVNGFQFPICRYTNQANIIKSTKTNELFIYFKRGSRYAKRYMNEYELSI